MNYSVENNFKTNDGWLETLYREEILSDKNFSVRSVYYKKDGLLEMELFYDNRQSIGKVSIYDFRLMDFNDKLRPRLLEIFTKEISIFKDSK